MLAEFEQQYGREALEKAISGGQYNDPSGPFMADKAQHTDVWSART